ncbi:VanW family protein [Acrocarpospora catenulata]|uniref:VanW family protein n=1 Tax=Acrocarpospora catenulata TaxID=2836182 RepID=UPI001BD96B3E|nr:VanW family protein [Acrocarpospora catenulata]
MRRVPLRFRRRLLVIVGGTLTLLLLGYGIPVAVFAGEVPPNTWVAGVGIGGLAPADAEDKLGRALSAAADQPLTAVLPGGRKRLKPAELGLSIDLKATVAAAADQSLNPVGVARSLFGRRDFTVRVRVDQERLAAAVDKLAAETDRTPREGSVRFRGLEPRITKPRAGARLDRQEAAKALRAAYPGFGKVVPLRVETIPPAVSEEEMRRALSFARAAVSAPVVLTNESRTSAISREDLAANLKFVPDGATLTPVFDAKRLAQEAEPALVPAEGAPKDATFTIVNGKPKIVPSRAGQGIDPAALGESIIESLSGEGSRTISVPLTQRQPALTTEQARKLGVRAKVSSATTYHPCCAPRVTNIHRIADILDGHMVRPGETFSLNGIVGKRDKARGFVEAPMILNNRFVNDVGGGISQFATTMFNAVFFGGFQDVQHTPHQYYISRYPAGRESTVSYPQPDFRWRNDSPYGVLINTSYTGTSITVEFWSTKRFDIESRSSGRYDVRGFPTLSDSGPDCIPMGGAEGFTIDIWRIFNKDGKVVREQKFHTVYDPEPRLTCS